MNDINILKHPFTTLYYAGLYIKNHSKPYLRWCLKYSIYIIAVMVASFAIAFTESPISRFLLKISVPIYFAFRWILLGVLSSIGLGTGLHTFVIYLGPHIAKYTLAAYQCNSLPIMTPSRWNFVRFEGCSNTPLSFFRIVIHIQLEAFLWGIGTALGELPPYFVSRLAIRAQKAHEPEANDSRLFKFVRRLLEKHLVNHTFILIMLMASIPNPLFDLAGITCGVFNIPFWRFFLPTFIGKAVNKATVQSLVVVLIFSKQHIENFLIWLKNLTSIDLTDTLENTKKQLFEGRESHTTVLSIIWDVVVGLMVLYFICSIIQSIAKLHIKEKTQKNVTN